MGRGPPGSSVHGILQARILELVAVPSSRDIPDPGMEPEFLTLQVNSLPPEPPGSHKGYSAGDLLGKSMGE